MNLNYEKIRDNIIDFKDNYPDKLRELHTKMIVESTKGNQKARNYLFECIRQELISISSDYKNKDLADPIILDIYSKYWGLSILEKYNTPDIDELMIDGTRISIEKKGILYDIPEKFNSNEEAEIVIRRVLEHDEGQDLSINNPIKLTKMKDGARVTASLGPISQHPELNIRKFDNFFPTTKNLISEGTITKRIANIVELFVEGKLNISVIGEMGSGKTIFLKWLLGFMPKGERIGILENEFELNPQILYPELYFVQLRENSELGIELTDLFKLMLRKNVKRIILGELRSGKEVYQFNYACSRGHSGSIATSHNMNADGLIDDYADMVIEEGLSNNKLAMKKRIASSVNIVIKFRKLNNGKRICASIEEIITSGDDYKVSPIFLYEFDEENPSNGKHIEKNKLSPASIKKMNDYGVPMSKIKDVLGYV